MVAPCLSGSLLGFDSARYGDFDFNKRFKICQPLLKSDTRNKSIQNQSFINKNHSFIKLTATYISDILSVKIVNRELRNNKGLLVLEHTPNSAFGERAFSVAAPKLWNKLPFAIRNIDNVNRFKKELKTYLFQFC